MERRAGGELRALGGRRVAGVLLRYGDTARLPDGRLERTEPQPPDSIPATVAVNVQHDPALVAGTLTLAGDGEAIRAEGEVSPGVHDLIRRGALGGLSMEFEALRERTEQTGLSGGVRVLEAIRILGAGLVDRPAYPASGVEARRKLGGYGTRIVYGNESDCSCAGADCDTVSVEADGFEALRLMQEGAIKDGTDLATRLRTIRGITDEALERIRNSPVHREGGRSVPQVSAIARGAGDVVADTVTNSLRFEFRKDGMHVIVDPLDTEAGRRIRELIGAGVAVHARPVIDFKRSAFVKDGRTARFSLAWFDYVLVKPTNRTRGVDPLRELLNRPVSRRRKRLLLLGAA